MKDIILELKKELLSNCALECEKCCRLRDEIIELKKKLYLYNELLDEVDELRIMCDEKSEIINSLINKIN